MGVSNPSAGTPSEEQAEVTLASHTTLCDPFNQTTNNIYITGTTTISTFVAAPRAGMRRRLRFASTITLTNSANLICIGNNNTTCYTGTIVDIESVTTTTFRVVGKTDAITADYTFGAAFGRGANGNTYGAAFGYTSSGNTYGAAFGYTANTNAMNYAVALGYYSKNERWNEFWKGDGASPNLKGWGVWQWYGNTTNATPTELLLGGTANKRGVLLANSAIAFDIDILAATTAGDDCAMWNITGLIKRGAIVASTVIVGTPVVAIIAKDTGAASWDVVVTADATNGALIITVKGAAGVTIGWVATNKVFTERRF